MADLSQSRVRRLFNYDHENGGLIWCNRPISDFSTEAHQRAWNTKYSGKQAGTYSPRLNSVIVGIDGKSHRVHRLVWFWHYGEWPTMQIDHINGNGNDNHIVNLRDVSCSENHKNMPLAKNSRTQIIGVRLHPDGRWIAEIKVGTKNLYLGCFSDIRMAAAARKAAEKIMGYHENHGRPSQIAERRKAS